ncbi:MAG: aromatic ring-hydroxylating dioxygenase subunit alpha [Nitrososphaerota archaeon]|jgi:phenylpropionate dioxygenase-like ring-hydroxylating dioxygenase large terminal subunit|nr:aromatic ring-hydroxylating dioxygenase subunit alpha [Nitrososphaerota archaeon]MDG6941515.1 aromatic ring-hydroxylating dioxygenase subunit alpha [Nitrososphaerota archaeon]MDG6951056.1 aromatic ring-hydroxylating dioxygenase subunit alpha [Nitrososphaerota archaeon]
MIEDPVLVDDWHPVARSSDLGEASILPLRLLGEDLIAWRVHGVVKAWQDLCIHRGTKLSLGRLNGDLLECAYHGWTYNQAGECVKIPAHPEQKPPPKARVKAYHCAERYGLIWVCLGEPARDIPDFEEWGSSAFRKVPCGPYHYSASGPRAVENFLDVAHLPFVHEGILGERAHAEILDYEVQASEEGIIARDVRIWQPDPDGTGVGKDVNYTYRVLRPLTMYLSKETVEGTFSIFATVCPVSEFESTAWFWIAMDYGHDIPAEDIAARQDEITSQDIPVVESQRPERLPLDLQAELHLRSDRIAVAYRKWLCQLGLSFGTA